MYQILERYLREGVQERLPINATRLVVHSTANPGASDETHFLWLDSDRRSGWAHYYLDWDSISQLVPEGLMAPANGPSFNSDAISIELCEPSETLSLDERQSRFTRVWSRAVWLAADILHRYGWDLDRLYSHAQVSRMHPDETDHTDPEAFFATYGRTWADFVAAVGIMRDRLGAPPAAEPWQEEIITAMLNERMPDGEPFLAQRRHPNQPVTWWELGLMLRRSRARGD